MTKGLVQFSFLISLSLLACSSGDGSGNFVGSPSISSSSVDLVSSSSVVAIIPVDYSAGAAMNKKLRRGINMGNTFDATCETCWGAGPITQKQVDTLAALGFNSIRLPVRWDVAAAELSPYTIDPAYISRIQEVLGWIQNSGMRAIINMHHHTSFVYDTLGVGNPNVDRADYHIERVVAIWSQIAEQFATFDNDFLIFEMFNEPVFGVTSDYHNRIIAETYPIIRKFNPGRTLMYNAYPWGKYTGLRTLQLPSDGNIIFTAHYYEPYTFTHLGVNMVCPETEITWEGSSTEYDAVTKHFDAMVALAEQYYPGGLPINIGEFGATDCGGQQAQAKWTAAITRTAEKHNMSWHYWGFTRVGGFEIYEKSNDSWRTDLVKALLPD